SALNYYYAINGNYDSTIITAKEMLALSNKLHYQEGIAYAYLGMAFAYSIKKDSALQTQYYNKAVVLYKATKNLGFIMSCYDNMATVLQLQGNYGKAVENRYASQKIREQTGDKKMIADGYYNIATAYEYSDSRDKQATEILKNANAAVRLYKEINDRKGIGLCYSEIGDAYVYQGEYTKGLEKFIEAQQVFKDSSMSADFASTYAAIGNTFIILGDSANEKQNKILATSYYQKAKENELAALNAFRGYLYFRSEAYVCFYSLGRINMKLKNLSAAKKYLDSSLAISKSISDAEGTYRAYYFLSLLDSLQMNYKGAYKNYKLYTSYRDSVNNKENTKKAVQAQMQYEFDKKETAAKAAQDKKDAEAKRLKNEQYFAIAALGIIVLAVVAIAFIQFKNKKQKQRANTVLEKTLTDLKSTQAQLIQSEKMASLGELTAGIAHEIQNPLNFVNNFSEVNKELVEELKIKNEQLKIEDDDVKDLLNDIEQNLEKINHHGKRADAIVKNMLQHSKQTKGVKEPTDINALCDEYIRLSYHGLRGKDKNFNADIKTDFDESIEKINIIPQDIGRVLLNLFNNAFYAVNEKQKLTANGYQPTISVQTKRINDKVEIVVRDNGNGIPQSIIDKIFQPFFTTKPTGQGTGLGLSLSYDIITKEHNGIIKVNSNETDGSEFIIQLPVT
ncbi:MAG TPA: ATP-binding protein, partial [Parafilimonas sp.]|nr:ATP-binding protein [Parafilimonas sp.]